MTALLLVTLALALVAAGCGDDEGPQIPRDQAAELIKRLREADRRLSQDPPVCGDLSEETVPELEDLAAGLPEETDDGVKETVREGIEYLRDQIEAECASRREEKPDKETTTTEEEPPPTTTQEEPPPTTAPPETTEPPPTTTPPPTEEPPTTPPDNGGGGQGPPEGGGVSPGRNKKDKKD